MIIKLTNYKGEQILIGTESIIEAKPTILKWDKHDIPCTEIKSRGAMVATNYVLENIDVIYSIINDRL